MSSTWIAITVIVVVAIVADSIVKIIKASQSGGKTSKRASALEEDLAQLEADLADARERIVVLEKIVTDEKHNLSKEIDDLASGH